MTDATIDAALGATTGLMATGILVGTANRALGGVYRPRKKKKSYRSTHFRGDYW